MIKGDFHIHTCFSPDSFLRLETLIEACRRAGIGVVAITDHNTIRGAQALRDMAPPFRVIIGEEVSTRDGEIIGLFLEETVPRGLSAVETAQRIRDQGGLVQVPHPFDRFRNKHIKYRALLEVLPLVHIVEAFNARTTLKADIMRGVRFIQEHERGHGILPTSVTDSHTRYEIGNAWVEMPEFKGRDDFLDALRHGKIVGRQTTPLIHLMTRFTKLTKRWLQPVPS